MRRVLSLAAILVVLAPAAPAEEFNWMVREFSRQTNVQQLHIPFFGLARFAVAVAHPAGVSGLKLAVFENPNVPPEDFSRIADSISGNLWKPMIRIREKNGERTNIYLQPQPDGRRLKLLIATLDKADAVFVQVVLKPEALMKFVDERKHGWTHSAD